MNISSRFTKFVFALTYVLFFTTINSVYAGSTISATVGDYRTISYVSGGSNSYCTGSVDGSVGAPAGQWNTAHWYSGSIQVGPFNTPGSFTFACYGNVGAVDYTYVNVSCGPNTFWDGSSCKPDTPTGLNQTCNNAEGTNATLNWSAGANTTRYFPRFSIPIGQSCPVGWTLNADGLSCYVDNHLTNSITLPINESQNYRWWVYAGNDSGINWTTNSSDVICHRPTGSLTLSSSTCAIATGASSCALDATWTTANPFGTSAITRTNPNRTEYTGNNGGPSPVTLYGPPVSSLANFYLYNSAILLDTKSASATCAVGGWDSISGMCVNPLVTSVTITGQYYSSPGTISFTCSGSNNYTVRNTDTNAIVATGVYSGPRSVSVGPTGNYGVVCGYGAYLSNSTVRYYNAPPPPLPVVSLISSPRTLVRDAQTTLTWDIQWPVNACTFTAESVCTNGNCNAAQLSSEAALTSKLRTESTDASDPSGVRTINSSIKTFAPGHIDTDWKALGRKTITVANTMDITIDCGSSRKATTRVQVTSSNEQ